MPAAVGRSSRRSNMPAMPSSGDAAVCWRGSEMCVSQRPMHGVWRTTRNTQTVQRARTPPQRRNSSLGAGRSTVQATEPEPRLPSQTITHQHSKSTASVQQVNSCGPPTQHSQPSKRFAYGAVHKHSSTATVCEANGGKTGIHCGKHKQRYTRRFGHPAVARALPQRLLAVCAGTRTRPRTPRCNTTAGHPAVEIGRAHV